MVMARAISPTSIWTTVYQKSTLALVRRKQRTVAGSVHSVVGEEVAVHGTPAAIGILVELIPRLQISQTLSLGLRRNPQPIRQTATLGLLVGTRKTRRRLLPAGSTLGTSVHLMKRERTRKPRKINRAATTIGTTSRPLARRRRNSRRRLPSKILPTTRTQPQLGRHLRTLNLLSSRGVPGELHLPRKRRARKAKKSLLRLHHHLQPLL